MTRWGLAALCVCMCACVCVRDELPHAIMTHHHCHGRGHREVPDAAPEGAAVLKLVRLGLNTSTADGMYICYKVRACVCVGMCVSVCVLEGEKTCVTCVWAGRLLRQGPRSRDRVPSRT